MKRCRSRNHSHNGFTLVEVLVASSLLAAVMIAVNRIAIQTLVGTATEQKRTVIEAEIQNNIQRLQQANSEMTLSAIPKEDQPSACLAPESYLISQLESRGTRHYVRAPQHSKRSFRVDQLDDGWRVVEVAYAFEAPEETLTPETRLINLHPSFQPNCP